MLQIINPATGQTLNSLRPDTQETLHQKFKKAKRAQVAWAQTPLEERLRIITGFRKILVEKAESLAATLTSEMGKPIGQARNELKGVLARIDFFLENTGGVLADESVFRETGLEEMITHEPLGVVANISAWNYPYFVGSNVFIPALLTGNAVLYKPSEFATLTGLAIEEAMRTAGVPDGVFSAVIGTGSVGADLLNLPVNGVFFTGSWATGRKIAEVVAPRMVKMQFELGGKDPIYVCDNIADLDGVAAGVADGAFYNTGQSCCSVERIYVHEKIYPAFVESFVRTVRSFVVGDPLKDTTYIGPITRAANLETLVRQVKDAQAKGARLLCGGKRIDRAGYYFEPTVFSEVDHTMELMREESFGPIIGIQRVKSDEEALTLMNDSDYGLTAGVYSADRARAQAILRGVQAGSAYWNCCDRVSPRLPWTGRGHSGIGSTLSKAGIAAFVQPKAWHLRG